MRTNTLYTLLAVLCLAGSVSAKPERDLTWKQTDTSLTLLNNGKLVWQHLHDRATGKPCLRFGLLDGSELTRPVPMPDGYLNSDHVWHRGLWWSWKYINTVNFWEQNHTGTDPVKVDVSHQPDGSARIALALDYHLENQAPLVQEKRVVNISAPDETGGYEIDWDATFTNPGEKDVVFNKNSYGGFAYRGAAEFSDNKKKTHPAWTFLDAEGRENGSNNKRVPWVGFAGKARNGRDACIAILDHPSNPRHPSWWQTRNNYPYLNPSLTCKEDYVLKPGATLKLRYRVLVREGTTTVQDLQKAWSDFSR